MSWKDVLNLDVGAWARRRFPFLARRRKEAWPGPRYIVRRSYRLVMVTDLLCSIIRCNAPLVGGLEAAAVDAPEAKLEALLLALRDDLASGMPLSAAMRRRHRFFPRAYVDMVAAGERTGRLFETLSEMSDIQLRLHQVQQGYAVLSAFPAMWLAQIMAAACVSAIALPALAEILGDFDGVSLPETTRILFRVVDRVEPYTDAILVSLPLLAASSFFAAAVIQSLLRRRGRFAAAVNTIGMRLPVCSTVIVKRNLAHVARLMRTLLQGGVPMDDALGDAAAASDLSPLYAARMTRVRNHVASGHGMASVLETDARFFPAGFVAAVSIGESSGLLPDSLDRVARVYQRDVEKASRMLAELIFPLTVLVMAAATAFVAHAFFSTLVTLYDALFYSM